MLDDDVYVVGVGASAGGLEPIKTFLSCVEPEEADKVVIIISQHLSPTHDSILTELLKKSTSLQVKEAADSELLQPGSVYITPPGFHIEVKDSTIRLLEQSVKTGPIPSVDILFSSMAEQFKGHAVGIVLSGTGTDGSKGIQAIHERAGTSIVQSPETAKYDGMPNACVRSGYADYTAPVEEIWNIIAQVIHSGPGDILPAVKKKTTQNMMPGEAAIFEILQQEKGVDFGRYKINTLLRRIEKRMHEVGMTDIQEYKEILQTGVEIDHLFDSLLIGYTYFFRDTQAFEDLKDSLEVLIRSKKDKHLRVWVPGCATGEEAYSIAIIINELLEQKNSEFRVQIFASDIDLRSLELARKGQYDKRALGSMDEALITKYFSRVGARYEVSKKIRSMILFSRHDIIKDPHFLNLDLISCRNLFIYFKEDVQKQLIPMFYHSLNKDGLFFMGNSENIRGHHDLFNKLQKKHARIFSKKYHPDPKGVLLRRYRTQPEVKKEEKSTELSVQDAMARSVLTHSPETMILVNERGEIHHIEGDTSLLFRVPQGPPRTDLFSLSQDRINVELRRLLDKAVKSAGLTEVQKKQLVIRDQRYIMHSRVLPVSGYSAPDILYLFCIRLEQVEDIIESASVENADPDSQTLQNYEIRVKELENELEITKEYLQNYVEELETANEELQSMNEELLSTNEELQSSNEELETSNEELQSTTEEIRTAYQELHEVNRTLEIKENELKDSKQNMSSLLDNSMQAFLLFNTKGELITLNPIARQFIKQWSSDLPSEEDHYTTFLPMDALREIESNFKKALKGNSVSAQFDSKNVEGRILNLRYHFSPVLSADEVVTNISMGILDFTDYYQLQKQIEESRAMVDSIFTNVNIAVMLTDEQGVITKVNDKFCELFGYSESEIRGQQFTAIVPPENRNNALKLHSSYIQGATQWPAMWKLVTKEGRIIDVESQNSLISEPAGEGRIISTFRDVTDVTKYKTILEAAGHTAKIGGWELDVKTGVVEWTDEIFEIYGMKNPGNGRPSLENALSCYPGDARTQMETLISRAFDHGEPYDVEMPFVSVDGTSKWIRTTCQPVIDNEVTIKLLGTFQDISESKSAEEDLKKLSLVATKSSNGIVISDGRGLTEWVNEAFMRMSGYTFEEMKGEKPGDLLQGPATDQSTVKQISKSISNGSSFMGKILNYRKDGTPYWNELSIAPVIDDDGEIRQFISVQNDVTPRVRLQEELESSLREKEVLLKEVHHRVKNNLALVNSMLYLQEKDPNPPSVPLLLQKTQNRIQSIAAVHELIYQNESFAEIRVDTYIDMILKQVSKMYLEGNKGLSIEKFLKPITLGVDQAIPLALIVNEVVTNSLKHAFSKNTGSKISVMLDQMENLIKLSVVDDGAGLPDGFDITKTNSLGLTLIRQFSLQLEGSYSLKNNESGGVSFQLIFSPE